MTLNKDQVGRDKANKINKEKEEKKMKIMQERMEFIQKGIKELQEKAQVRIIPVLKNQHLRLSRQTLSWFLKVKNHLKSVWRNMLSERMRKELEAEKAEKAAKEQEGKAGQS
jgi:aspartyl/asparaginyl-tRNA synthetase